MRSNAVVGIILDKRKRILLQKKDDGHLNFPDRWCLFGGQINKNETPKHAFDREMKEELNCKLTNKKYRFKQRFSCKTTKGELKGIIFCFEAKFNGSIKNLKIKEGAGFAFLKKDELDLHPMHRPDKKILIKYFSLFYPSINS